MGTDVQTKPEGWRDAVQNSTSSCMPLTFHNKIGLTNSMMHGIYLLNSKYKRLV